MERLITTVACVKNKPTLFIRLSNNDPKRPCVTYHDAEHDNKNIYNVRMSASALSTAMQSNVVPLGVGHGKTVSITLSDVHRVLLGADGCADFQAINSKQAEQFETTVDQYVTGFTKLREAHQAAQRTMNSEYSSGASAVPPVFVTPPVIATTSADFMEEPQPTRDRGLKP